jgi:RNA ligase (TIGR02306 family)
MSEFHVNVIRIGPVEKHPNADTLSVTHVHGGYPCIIKTGSFAEGDLAVYIPIDTTLPDVPQFAFLGNSDRKRLGAKKLRGIFSMGLLIPAPQGTVEGQDVAELLDIKRYEPPEPALSTYAECEPAPKGWPFVTYTDIEGLRRYPDVLQLGEPVVVTEKIHGANARYVHDGKRLWVGSRTQIKRESSTVLWWKVAHELQLSERLAAFPYHIFFGEAYGQVQDLRYGFEKGGASLLVFDVFDVKAGRYLDHANAMMIAIKAGLSWVPLLYSGSWKPELVEYAEGQSKLADHVREGIVVKPLQERFDDRVGRVILKMHGQGYLLRSKKRRQRK